MKEIPEDEFVRMKQKIKSFDGETRKIVGSYIAIFTVVIEQRETVMDSFKELGSKIMVNNK